MIGQKSQCNVTGKKGKGVKERLAAVLLAVCFGLSACTGTAGAEGGSMAGGSTGTDKGYEAGGSSVVDEVPPAGGSEADEGLGLGEGYGAMGQDPAGAAAGLGTDGSNGGALDPMEVHFIDAGQGDATLIKCGGQNLLIDTSISDKGTAIQNYLTKQGVEKLDYLVLTHPDSDHIGGAPVVITKFEIGQVFISNFEKDNSTYRKMIQALDDKMLKASVPEVGSTFSLGSAVCTVLAPNNTYEDPNNASVALLIQNGENRFLFTGDAEEEAEKDILANGLDLKADVYKAGHHGSRTSSCEELLDAVDPEFAVISCGEGNSYGHPHAQTLNNLRAREIKVYRTDEQGSLIAVSDGSTITWNAAPSETWQAGEPSGSSSGGSGSAGGNKGTEAADSQAGGGQSAAGQTGGEANADSPGQTGGQANAGSPDQTGGQANAGSPDQTGGQANAGGQDAQPQISQQTPEDNQIPAAVSYVLNTKTKKFHKITCSYLPTANRKDTDMSRDEIVAQGYEPCKKCNP